MCPHANDSIQNGVQQSTHVHHLIIPTRRINILLSVYDSFSNSIAVAICDQVIMLIHEIDLIARALAFMYMIWNDDG